MYGKLVGALGMPISRRSTVDPRTMAKQEDQKRLMLERFGEEKLAEMLTVIASELTEPPPEDDAEAAGGGGG